LPPQLSGRDLSGLCRGRGIEQPLVNQQAFGGGQVRPDRADLQQALGIDAVLRRLVRVDCEPLQEVIDPSGAARRRAQLGTMVYQLLADRRAGRTRVGGEIESVCSVGDRTFNPQLERADLGDVDFDGCDVGADQSVKSGVGHLRGTPGASVTSLELQEPDLVVEDEGDILHLFAYHERRARPFGQGRQPLPNRLFGLPGVPSERFQAAGFTCGRGKVGEQQQRWISRSVGDHTPTVPSD
jgi:hypothetical protein